MTEKQMSVEAILFWTVLFPSLFLCVAFFVGVAVVAYASEDYHTPAAVEVCGNAHP